MSVYDQLPESVVRRETRTIEISRLANGDILVEDLEGVRHHRVPETAKVHPHRIRTFVEPPDYNSEWGLALLGRDEAIESVGGGRSR